jgi:hypothetical protein
MRTTVRVASLESCAPLLLVAQGLAIWNEGGYYTEGGRQEEQGMKRRKRGRRIGGKINMENEMEKGEAI